MIAVFESNQKYLQINKGQVMNIKLVEHAEEILYSESGTPDRKKKAVVGTSFTEIKGSFLFCEGDNHNTLTLRDPKEIEALRAFIKNRDDIREIGSLSVR